MSVYEAMKWGRYLHPTHGMASNRPHTGQNPGYQCDNYWLYTGHLLRCMKDAGEPYRETLTPTVRAFFEATRVKPGLFSRFPGRAGDDVSQDEIIGQAYLARELGLDSFMDEIIERGFRSDWCFDTREPEKWSPTYWYARHIYFKPFVLTCSQRLGLSLPERWRRTVNLGHLIQWHLVLRFDEDVPATESDGRQRIWLQIDVMRGRNPITSLAISHWEPRMAAKFPGAPRGFMATYFGATNPLTLATPERFS